MINIIENTLRDGSYRVNFKFSADDTYRIVRGLDKLGFRHIEVGHGLGLGAWNKPHIGLARENDKRYIKAARKAAKNAKIGTFFIPHIGTKDDIKLAVDSGIDFIRVGINIHEYKKTEEYVALAKKYNLEVAVNLMKSYAVKSYQFTQIVTEIDKWGLADIVYLVDSAGCMVPHEVKEYIERTKEKVTTNLGFHGHNNLSLAVANSLEAIKAGATYVDTCVRSMGRSAGNAQTEIVIYLLQKMNLIEYEIDIYKLYKFANEFVVPLMPESQGLSDEEIHIGVSKFHTSFMKFADTASEKFNVDKKKLIKQVSDINCLNPTQNLFDEIAKSLPEKNEVNERT